MEINYGMIRNYDQYKLATPPGFAEQGEYEGSPRYHEASGKFLWKGSEVEFIAGQENEYDEPTSWLPDMVEYYYDAELDEGEDLAIKNHIIEFEIDKAIKAEKELKHSKPLI